MAEPLRLDRLRWLVKRDIPEVLEIERAAFSEPWNEDDFRRVLRQRNVIGMVAEYQERIVGYMIYTLESDDLRLSNFVVHPDYRRCRVGHQMVCRLKAKLDGHRRRKITLTVGERNLTAQLFFRSQGFKAKQVIRGFYRDSDEDAYAMEYHCPQVATIA